MASAGAVAVLITERGKQLSLLLTLHFGAVQQLLNLGELTVQELVKQPHRMRIIGHLRVRRQRAARRLDAADDRADFGTSVVVGGENLFEQAGQLVIGLGERAAGLLISSSGVIDAPL
nr:hypothetical protein [Mycobacterium paraseoulense]